jgi:HEAT repeats
MRFARSSSLMICILIINLSLPASLFSQSGQPQHPRNRQQESLAAAISELLKLAPLPPESPDDRASSAVSNDRIADELKKPPDDDVPLGKLIEYWSGHSDVEDRDDIKKPSEKVSYRLLEACEDRPRLLEDLINLMPETPDASDRLYRLFTEEKVKAATWKDRLRIWLMRHSSYFRDELIELASSTNDDDKTQYYLEALAKLDWEVARPLLERLAGEAKPKLTPVALSLFYKRAVERNDDAQIENYRKRLMEVVTNDRAWRLSHPIVLKTLMSTEWSGQEDWFVSLFKNPFLTGLKGETDGSNTSNSKDEADDATIQLQSLMEQRGGPIEVPYLNPLSIVLRLKPDKWIPVITKLIGDNNRNLHNGAVSFMKDLVGDELADKQNRKEAARLLLPWLNDPEWSSATGRSVLIEYLGDLELPECVPGLINVLETERSEEACALAAKALRTYRNPGTIPALRRALERQEDEAFREYTVTTIALAGGFSDDEMTAAIEAYARAMSNSEGEETIMSSKNGENEEPLPMKVSIGRIIHESDEIQITEGLAASLFARVDKLRSKQPKVAKQILKTIREVPLHIADVKLIERLREGTADIDDLTFALEFRDSLQENVAGELHALFKRRGYVSGIAAAMLNDRNNINDLLAGKDSKAQLALLACARYLRDKLPIDSVAALLNGPDRILAKAAGNYLEVEDSAEARKLIIAKHPREAFILGDIYQLDERQYMREAAQHWEESIRREVLSPNGIDEIYSFLFPSTPEDLSGIVIRVKGGKAELSLSEVTGRRRVRMLSENEFQELKDFTSRQDVDDLGPQSWEYDETNARSFYVYWRLTREGGRRILLDHFERAPKNPTLHEELSGHFYRLAKSGEFKERYALEDKVRGLEVVIADDEKQAYMVCMEGSQVRVLVGKESFGGGLLSQSLRAEWRSLSSGQLGGVTDEPSACRSLELVTIFKNMSIGGLSFGSDIESSLSRFGNTIVFTTFSEKEQGIWKMELGSDPVKILNGNYSAPLLIDAKKLLFAVKYEDSNGKSNRSLIRYSIETGQESVITPSQEGFYYPVAYLADHGKILITDINYQSIPDQNYLLDPESGIMQPVKGNFRPLFDRDLKLRPLQPAGRPHEYWSGLYNDQKRATTIGVYNAKSFVFKPLLDLHDIGLRSVDFWADVENKKLWFTYQGHLLRLPLPEQVK